ncbi:MAG: MFS transporter [Bacteroidales bacterium]
MKSNSSNTKILLYTVYFIYFFCGLVQCFESIFPNEFMDFFHLNNTQWSYTSTAKNLPFLVLSVLVGYLATRIGYKKCLSIAMFLYTIGTILIVAALQMHHYILVLFAFFIVGTGFNFQLVAGNPMLSGLGNPSGCSSRLNIGNALGAIAWIIAPLIISIIVPATIVDAADKIPYMVIIFIVIAVVLGITAFFTLFAKNVEISFQSTKSNENIPSIKNSIWKNPKVLLGFLAIFLVLGTEGGIFTFFQVYLKEIVKAMGVDNVQRFKDSIGIDLNQTQLIFTFFFVLYAAGRLLAAAIQKNVKPSITVIVSLIIAIAFLLLLAIGLKGVPSIIILCSLGLFISLLFPTLYALAIEGMGTETAKASGLLTMGFLGAAVIPVIQGKIADLVSLQISFSVAIITYSLVLIYTLFIHKLK